MEKLTEFIYKTPVPTNLIEHEYLHVFLGTYDGAEIAPNPEEVKTTKRLSFDELDQLVDNDDASIAPWTKMTWKKIRGLM